MPLHASEHSGAILLRCARHYHIAEQIEHTPTKPLIRTNVPSVHEVNENHQYREARKVE